MDKKEYTGPLFDLGQLDEIQMETEVNAEEATKPETNLNENPSVNNFNKEPLIDNEIEKNKAKKWLVGIGSAALVGVVLAGSVIGINIFGNNKDAAAEAPKAPNRTENIQVSNTNNETEKPSTATPTQEPEANSANQSTELSQSTDNTVAEKLDTKTESKEYSEELSLTEIEEMSIEEFEKLPQNTRIKAAKKIIDYIVESQIYRSVYKNHPEQMIVPVPDSLDNTPLEVANNIIFRKQIACSATTLKDSLSGDFDLERALKITSACYDSIDNEHGELVSKDYVWLKDEMSKITKPACYKEKVKEITNQSGIIDIVQGDQDNKTNKGIIVEYKLYDDDIDASEFVFVTYGNNPNEGIWLLNQDVDDYNTALQERLTN